MEGNESIRKARSPKWSRDFVKGHLSAWARSGLTLAEYARSQGLSVKRFPSWKARLARKAVVEGVPKGR